MSRSIASLLPGLVSLLVCAEGCNPKIDEHVGEPCVASIELDPSFKGFDKREVSVSGSSECGAGVCLVNHFQGRVSCAYGQSADGGKCTTPTGAPLASGLVVPPQCVGRTAKVAVTCSCRCANALGRTDDGGNYCECPEDFECSQLVLPIPGEEKTTGGYCVRRTDKFNESHCNSECNQALASDVAKCGTP